MVFSHSTAITSLVATDLERAKNFYINKLGLHLKMELPPDVILLATSQGNQILIYKREKSKADHTVLSFAVKDLEASVADLKTKGISLEIYEGLTDDKGIATRGEQKAAWFKDSEGNIINILSQPKVT